MTREECLIILIEECGEVIQAATKCLRFGFTRNWPGYGINHEVLAREVGDLLGVLDTLPLDQKIIDSKRSEKMVQVEKWKTYFLDHPVDETEWQKMWSKKFDYPKGE